MWPFLTDHLPALIAALTALAGLVGAWLRLKPRRLISWIAATKEREMLLAMLEHEKQWGLYWKAQADQCWTQLTERRR